MDEREHGGRPPGGGGETGGGELAEERRMILRMLESGRITPEQALELLKALQAGTPAEEGARAPESGERGSDFMGWVESTASRMGELADELGERVSRALSNPAVQERLTDVGERLEEIGRTVAERMARAFGQLGRSAYPEHVMPQELAGDFAEGAVPVVELATGNGSIRVVGVPGAEVGGPRGWRLRVERRIRARSRAEAEQEAANLVEIDRGPGHLTVRATDGDWRWGPGHAVGIELVLSSEMAVSLRASTANGSVSARGVAGDAVEVRSTNGRLDLADVSARRVSATSTNGAVLLERVQAQRVEARSTNGSVTGVVAADELEASSVNGAVTVRPLAAPGEGGSRQRVEARTVNGSVRVALPTETARAAARGEVGLSLEATTAWGSARIELPDGVAISQTTRAVGHQRAVYQSPHLEQAARSVWVRASTRQGSAVIEAE